MTESELRTLEKRNDGLKLVKWAGRISEAPTSTQKSSCPDMRGWALLAGVVLPER